MARFVVNTVQQTNGDHEVHNATTGCKYMPNPSNQVDLGVHDSCRQAVAAAKARWPQNRINGCYYCCRECHTT